MTTYTVRIYGDGSLLEEVDTISGLEALETIATALGDGHTAELAATVSEPAPVFTWNRSCDDLEQVAEWLPAFTAIRDEITDAGGYPYNDSFKGRIPGLAGNGSKAEDTAIYLLQGLYRQREMQARLDGWLAEGFRPIDSVPAVCKFSHVILYRHADGTTTPDRSGEWKQYQDARLVPESKPRQAEVTGKISALLPKGKRTNGVLVGINSYAVLVKD